MLQLQTEGLQSRKKDLLEHIESNLKLNESNLFNSSNLLGKDTLPDALGSGGDIGCKKKRKR